MQSIVWMWMSTPNDDVLRYVRITNDRTKEKQRFCFHMVVFKAKIFVFTVIPFLLDDAKFRCVLRRMFALKWQMVYKQHQVSTNTQRHWQRHWICVVHRLQISSASAQTMVYKIFLCARSLPLCVLSISLQLGASENHLNRLLLARRCVASYLNGKQYVETYGLFW